MAVVNRGRQTQFINGINGVSAGGNATVNMDVNKRYHANRLQVSSVNYTGGTALPVVPLTGVGTGATATLTVVNGVVTAAVAVATGAAFVTGDTVTVTDTTGTGLVLTVTAAAGAITALAVTSVGTASATNPASVITQLKQIVNGVAIRDISVDNLLRICTLNKCSTRRGELPLFYTEPWFNVNQLNEILSWDTFGQSTFSIQPQISSVRQLPGMIGIMEFDYDRNVRPTPNGLVPFLQPVAQHDYTFNVIAGLNLINTIPFDYPIRRILINGATPGNITQLEILQDGNKVYEATVAQNQQQLGDNGFQAGQRSSLNVNSGDATIIAAYNPQALLQTPFDFSYITDIDQRIQKALTCENSLVLRVTSAIQQAITCTLEYLPGQYAA